MLDVRAVVAKQFETGCLKVVPFSGPRAYFVPLTVMVECTHGAVLRDANADGLGGDVVVVLSRKRVEARPSVDAEDGSDGEDGKEVEYAGAVEDANDGNDAENADVQKEDSCDDNIPHVRYVLEVRRVAELGEPYGPTCFIDCVRVVPFLLRHEEEALRMLQSMTATWSPQTDVVLHMDPERLEYTRLCYEYWANKNKICEASSAFSVVSSTYYVHLSALCRFLKGFEGPDTPSALDLHNTSQVAALGSFIDARVSGTNLSGECGVCMQPLLCSPLLRLGCPCGAAGERKGAVLHAHCAQYWLFAQENMWMQTYDPLDAPDAAGPCGPTCPFCRERLLGVAPFASDLTTVLHNETRFPRMGATQHFYMLTYHTMMTWDPAHGISRALLRLLRRDPLELRVDQAPGLRLGLPNGISISFPSADSLFLSRGTTACEAPNDAVCVMAADAIVKHDDMLQLLAERHNNLVYYGALGCEMRFQTQVIHWQQRKLERESAANSGV